MQFPTLPVSFSLRTLVVRLVVSLVGVIAIAVFMPSGQSRASAQIQTQTVLLSPTDTFINLNTTNYSRSALLATYTWPNYQPANAIIMKFNLSSIPAGAVVQSAKLKLALIESDSRDGATYTITAHKIIGRNPNIAATNGSMSGTSTAWAPSNCCYDGFPLAQSDISPAYASVGVSKTNGWKSWTITSMVQEWLASPTLNYGVLLNSDWTSPQDRYRFFASMEYPDATLRPVLEVTYAASGAAAPELSDLSITPPGNDDSFVFVPADTFLTLDDRNHSASPSLWTYTWPEYTAANAIVMKFDLSVLPRGASIQDATLHLALIESDGTGDATYTISAHKIANRNPVIGAANGYTYDGWNPWSWSPCCYDGVPLAQGDITGPYDQQAIDKSPGFKQWTLTRMVQEWVADPSSNYGVLLNSDTTKYKDRYRMFASSEHGNTSLRPYLSVRVANGSTSGGSAISNSGTSSPTGPLSGVSAGSIVVVPADTYLALDDSNKSASPTLWTYTWPDYTVANAIVMKFDLSALPPGASIQDAALHLALIDSDATADGSYTIGAHKIRNRNPAITAANGFTYDGSNRWTWNTCCYEGVPLAQGDITSPYDQQPIDQSTGFKQWTLTRMVQEWVADPSSNYGVLLNSDATKPKDRYRTFASAENGNASLRPYLTITLAGASSGTISNSGSTISSSDTSAPAVFLTSPSAGAIVAGNAVAVSASASDNVGVVGVQFTLDGANIGGEDLTAPYSVSWNTSSVANGVHSVTALARDAAGNQRASASVSIYVLNAVQAPSSSGISALYPGDVGIRNHSSVIFSEQFEDSIGEIISRWGDARRPEWMQLSSDVPPGGGGGHSLSLPFVGGVTDGGHLYKVLSPGIDDTLYVRYYIKYPINGVIGHNGIWIGGFNPISPWPNPQAGTKPNGDDRFIAGAEQTQLGGFDHYNYWMAMHLSNDGNYWGDLLLNNKSVQAARGQWVCVEEMVKLNNPTWAFNGEHALWLNGVKVSHLGPGFPNGYWSSGIFTQDPSGSPFEGFRWRATSALNLNWIWLQNYSPNNAAGVSGTMLFDHVVVATSYIGCLQ